MYIIVYLLRFPGYQELHDLRRRHPFHEILLLLIIIIIITMRVVIVVIVVMITIIMFMELHDLRRRQPDLIYRCRGVCLYVWFYYLWYKYCLFVYIYIYIHIHTYIYAYIYIYTHTHYCVYLFMHIIHYLLRFSGYRELRDLRRWHPFREHVCVCMIVFSMFHHCYVLFNTTCLFTPFTNKCSRTVHESFTNKQPKRYTHAFANRSRRTITLNTTTNNNNK